MIATIRWVALSLAFALAVFLRTGIASSAEEDAAAVETESTDAATGGDEIASSAEEEEDAAAVELDSAEPAVVGIDEIVVTTRRRDENTQELPASITAFDSAKLEELGITDATELTKFVPNLKFDTIAASSNTAQVFIRGIGQADGIINAEQGVGIYINGVYQSRSLGSIVSLGDIERVEVLRGPQGALYGKNAIGGSISFITKKPTDDYEASVAVTGANYATLNTLSILNIPFGTGELSEHIKSRFVFATETSDGWQRDIRTGTHWANNRNYIGRATLEFLPTDQLDITLRYEQGRSYERNSRPKCRLVPQRFDTYFYEHIDDDTSLTTLDGNFLDECKQSEDAGEDGVLTDLPNKNRLANKSANVTVDWLSPDVAGIGPIGVRAIGAWQRLDQDLNLELDGTSLQMLDSRIRNVSQEQWSGDLLFSASPLDERLDLTLGLFYLQEDIRDPGSLTQVQTIVPQIADVFGTFGQITAASVTSETDLRHQTAATFLQGVLAITDELNLTLGSRYVYEKKQLDRFNFFQAQQQTPTPADPDSNLHFTLPYPTFDFGDLKAGPPFVIPGPYVFSGGNEDFHAWTGVANLSYNLTEIINEHIAPIDYAMIFGGWSRGFRSGGFNYISEDSEATVIILPDLETGCVPVPEQECNAQKTKIQDFDPEYLNAFEVGLKTDWLDRRLRVNLTYFYDYHEDIQQRQTIVTDGAGFGTTNAVLNTGDAIFQGGEIEIEALPIPELYFRFGLGITDARYKGKILFDDEDASRALTEAIDDGTVYFVKTDISDDKLIHVPPIDVSATVAYTEEVFDWGIATASFSWYMSGDLYFTVQNKQGLHQPHYHVFDARLSFDLFEVPKIANTRARFEIWGKNLTDRRYLEGGINLVNYHLRYYNHPRTFGGTVTLSFDTGG